MSRQGNAAREDLTTFFHFEAEVTFLSLIVFGYVFESELQTEGIDMLSSIKTEKIFISGW